MNRTVRPKNVLNAAAIFVLGLALSAAADAAGTWTTKQSMPTPRVYAVAGAVGGQLFVVGGSVPPATTANELYDPANDAWIAKAPAPTDRAFAVSGVINGKLYVVGGCIHSDCSLVTNILEVYDPVSGAWMTKAPMPTARNAMAVAVIGGKLYVAGGMQQCGPCLPLSTLEVYDPGTDTWSSKAPMPSAQSQAAGAVANGMLYVIGGIHTWPAATGTVQSYDPTTDTWAMRTSMPTARNSLAVATVNNNVYAIGGVSAQLAALQTVEVYDATADRWSTEAPMPSARHGLVANVINGVIYAVGGQNGIILATDEAFKPAPALVPFASFAPKVEIALNWGRNNDDQIEVKGRFALGTATNGIAPTTEVVSLQVGMFNATMPAGSFKSQIPNVFTFEGPGGGGKLKAVIVPLGGRNFGFAVSGDRVNLRGTPDSVAVKLTIGDDAGSAIVRVEFD